MPTLTHLLPGNAKKQPCGRRLSRTFVALIHFLFHYNMKKQIYLHLLLLMPILATAQHRPDYWIRADGNCIGRDTCEAVVLAPSGLKMRTQPNFSAKSISVIPFGKKIMYISNQKPWETQQLQFDSDSVAGEWCRVFWMGKSGYAFSGYFGRGIFKMDKPFYLLAENAAACWDDAFLASNYHYYGVYPNRDTSAFTIKKQQPLFFNKWEYGMGGVTFSFRQKQLSYFAFATVEPFLEGVIPVTKSRQTLVLGSSLSASLPSKIKIPNTAWELQIKQETYKDEYGNENNRPRLVIRDSKTGTWHYLFEGNIYFEQITLDWCGDFDGDGIQDFMLYFSTNHYGGMMLFTSKNPGKWQFVKMVGIYFGEDCC